MQIRPDQALAAAQFALPQSSQTKPKLLIAGATGVLGNAVLRRLVGAQRFAQTYVLAREPMRQGMRAVSLQLVPEQIASWLNLAEQAQVALVMFEPPRMFYERERALWTPTPEQLPELASWLLRQGVRTLVVLLPHVQGSMPYALQEGLANLDEQALVQHGFERLILVRSAEPPQKPQHRHALDALAHWMIGIFRYMLPKIEQPVQARQLAEIVDALLLHAPAGIHVIGPQQVWELAQLDWTHMQAWVYKHCHKSDIKQ